MQRRLVSVLLMIAVAWGGLAIAFATDTTPRLGLDLQGGTSVILEAPAGTEPELVETAVEVMRRRIEDFGSVQEPEIAITGGTSVLVQLPGVTDQERALDAVGQTGQLSFRPVYSCTSVAPSFTCVPTSLSPIQLLAEEAAANGETFTYPEGVDPLTGLTIDDDIRAERSYVPEYDPEGNITAIFEVGSADLSSYNDTVCVEFPFLDCSRLPTTTAELTGSEVASALALFGQSVGGGWTVQLTLTGEGADLFAGVTGLLAQFPGNTANRRLAIVLDGAVTSAPEVNIDVGPEGITGGTAIITVGGSDDAEQDARDLTTVLRYGSLPVAFERSSVQKVSATLGEDSLQAGLAAGVGGLVLVILFLLIYYRAMGLVTLLGVSVFASLLVLTFGLLGAWQGLTLTLSGVAGVIVAIGITADSYIVFFERTKEEVHKGRTVEDATDEAFRRAFRTILTADFVSFMGALLLWVLAVGPVKGFAQALFIATILDVIVAYFFTRNAVGLLARSRLAERGWFSIRAASDGRAAEASA